MLARCDSCGHVFFADAASLPCPSCGAALTLGQAPGTTTASPEKQGIPRTPPSTATPWEQRHTLGPARAFMETIKLAVADPVKLFSTMTFDSLDGTTSFLFLAGVVPQLLGVLLGHFASDPAKQFEETRKMYEVLGQQEAAQLVDRLKDQFAILNGPEILVWQLVAVPLLVLAFVLLGAGVAHGALAATGHATRPFLATWKTFVYALAPGVFGLVPGCGGIVFLTWATGLQILGLMKTHGVTSGRATAAVLTFHGISCCFCCLAIAGAAIVTGAFADPAVLGVP